MNARTLAVGCVLLTVSLLAGGCIEPPTRRCPETALSLGQLTQDYNANADKVQQVWARAKIDMTVTDGKNTVTWGSLLGAPNGVILLGKGPNKLGPHDFVLQGTESGKPLFRVGTSTADNVYYVWFSVGSKGGAFVGSLPNAGAPGSEDIALDPLGLVSLLMVTRLPDDFTTVPTLGMTLNGGVPAGGKRTACAYVVTYIDRQPRTGYILMKREIYFNWDGQTPRPFRVDFIDSTGRRVVTATMGKYVAIPGTGTAGQEAVLPTDIRLEEIPWPKRQSVIKKIHLQLSELSTTEGDPMEAAKFWTYLPTNLRPGLKALDPFVKPPPPDEDEGDQE